MLFREGEVVGVLDWEIAQIGQPLLDLACQCVVAQASRSADPRMRVPGGGAVDIPDEQLLELYGDTTRQELRLVPIPHLLQVRGHLRLQPDAPPPG